MVEHVRFGEKAKIEFSGQKLVPVIKDGETVVNDSWAIACYLEDTYADRPSLFGGEAGRGAAKLLDAHDGAARAEPACPKAA
mgnify:CR=1 FL=1